MVMNNHSSKLDLLGVFFVGVQSPFILVFGDRYHWGPLAFKDFFLVEKIATAFALFVSCLGLFGLTSYETTRRTKEIGIRKAIGAKSWQIVAHFVRSFLWLLVLANIIAWPLALALFRLGAQLLRYPYPFDIGAVVFLQAGVISTLLTVITVSIQTLRAALVNPVNALRYE